MQWLRVEYMEVVGECEVSEEDEGQVRVGVQ